MLPEDRTQGAHRQIRTVATTLPSSAWGSAKCARRAEWQSDHLCIKLAKSPGSQGHTVHGLRTLHHSTELLLRDLMNGAWGVPELYYSVYLSQTPTLMVANQGPGGCPNADRTTPASIIRMLVGKSTTILSMVCELFDWSLFSADAYQLGTFKHRRVVYRNNPPRERGKLKLS